MGMYDSVVFLNDKKEEVDIQFKCGEQLCTNYKIGDSIEMGNGIYFGYEGVFVVFDKKVVAAFSEDSGRIFTKWGGEIPYPDIHPENPIIKMINLNKDEL